MPTTVTVDASGARAIVRGLRADPSAKAQLMNTLATGQLVSVRRTFAEEGSPAGSWAPLSPASLRWNKYTPGHKLLIGRGRLIGSIHAETSANTATIGTNLKYAGVHQYGFHGVQNVRAYSYTRSNKGGNRFQKVALINRAGRNQTVRRKTASGITTVSVRAHKRRLNIPARPYMVFRPEDPQRMKDQVLSFYHERIA